MTTSTRSTDAPGWWGTPLVALALVLGFALLVLWRYDWQPTASGFFLLAGWVSILAFGWWIFDAARSFDTESEAPLGLELDDKRREHLMQEKKLLLKAIKEIEFDAATGKVDEADAQAAIGRYRARAVDILKVLDKDKPVDYSTVVDKELQRRMARARKEVRS